MTKVTDRPGRRPWGGLEDEVLAALWAASGPVTATTVQTELGGDLAYGTITTILGRLRAKGLVVRTQIGRTYEYTPAQDAASHTASRMHSLLVSRSDRGEVLARFVSELSAEEGQLLHAVLRDIGDAEDLAKTQYGAPTLSDGAVPPSATASPVLGPDAARPSSAAAAAWRVPGTVIPQAGAPGPAER